LETKPILIAGGGVGGMTTALALAQRQIPVVLFEQAADFSDVGAGIQLSPNCSRVLRTLGLTKELDEQGFLPQHTQFRHWHSGKIISETSLGKSAEQTYGAPYYHFHRSDLLNLLLQAAKTQPLIQLKLNSRIESIEQIDDSVRVLVNGETHTGSALIGADGIHSKVRDSLFGAESPTFTGNVAWRALVPTSSLPANLLQPAATAWWGPGKHFVHYYVRGGTMVNCVCVVESKEWQDESWNINGHFPDLAAEFADWHPTINTLLANANKKNLYKWGLFDRPPMVQWSIGRITLLGDACHPTLPFMAQGAAMAIEDAAVIAGCLNQTQDPTSAFLRYEKLRKKRTAMIQQLSRRNAKVFHLKGIAAWARNRAAKRAGGSTMKKLYGFDALSVFSD
jgi:salicylate hydroxylase